jgi:hypothetical protein
VNNTRVQYLEFTETGKGMGSDTDWIQVVDQKTGVVYSGFAASLCGPGFIILRSEVEQELAEQEGDPDRLDSQWNYWPHEKSL